MSEEIAELLGVKIEAVAKAIQWIVVLIGVVAFLVFFAVAPLHCLVLFGLLIILGSIYFKVETKIQRMAFYAGIGLMILGIAGIFVPELMSRLLAVARQLKELLIV